MTLHLMRASTYSGRRMEEDCFCGGMAHAIMETLSTTVLKGLVTTDGLMAESTKASGLVTRCMVQESSRGQMVVSMKVNTRRTRSKVKALSFGKEDSLALIII